MTTFLEGVKLFRGEVNVAGEGPTTVIGQTGELRRLVNWYKQAHQEIQTKWTDWNFLWKEGSFNTIAAQSDYQLDDPTSMGGSANIITDFARIASANRRSGIEGPKIWIDATQQLTFVAWSDYDKNSYQATGKPQEFTINPSGKFVFAPTPDAAYAIDFEYYKVPQVLSADSDVSVIPDRFIRAVIGRAMILYANYEASEEIKVSGTEIYSEVLSQLEAAELPSLGDYRQSTNNNFVIEVED